MSSTAPTLPTPTDIAAIAAQLATLQAEVRATHERNQLLEQENRWLKSQLFGRSSEKAPTEERHPDQAWLFNEAEALAAAARSEERRVGKEC